MEGCPGTVDQPDTKSPGHERTLTDRTSCASVPECTLSEGGSMDQSRLGDGEVSLIHIILGTVGLAVIVGVIVSALAADWSTLLALVALALAAGLLTRFAIPRDH